MTAAVSGLDYANGHQSWVATLALIFAPRPAKTVLAERVQRGPLAVQRPFYPEGNVSHVYVLHPPGGVVGGDQLRISTQVKSGAHALLTSPGAMKFYRSQGKTATQDQQLVVDKDASLEWLPQETIYFPGAKSHLKTRIDLKQNSRFIGWEIHCLGLPANQEMFDSGELKIDLEVFVAGQPLVLESMNIDGKSRQRPTGLRGMPVMATLLATPADDDLLDQVRQELAASKAHFSATLLDNCLLVRYLGNSTAECRDGLIQVWKTCRPRVMAREACLPRIWST